MSLGPPRSGPATPHGAAGSALFLDPVQLVDFTRFVAAEVRAGRYPYIRYEQSERWHQRIYRDRRVDVWLISWLPDQGTQLHDHGGSSGAFTVLAGELAEAIHRPGAERGLVERVRGAGQSVGFGPRYVHDVRNLGTRPAVSVHAYSAPLRSMTYYDLDPGAGLRPVLSLPTEDPEPDVRLPGRGEPAA
ncbi:MAG TPA: cysteine dioxygenase family protein [Jatrophihabitans sp.]|nr:cysteine dioxygenase family protein [Jatrophihabitans sp.]